MARDHDVSARNPFSLLSAIGRECAGAVQFLPRPRTRTITPGPCRSLTTTSPNDCAR
ncbi:HipA N-terminal domain-containing protein [Corynebacterium glyciniphilum]|uniref:HipA N-terminal domain-containing protein n=1 Tax=Corynebacterium glyciniphilum TaxID=1404244 RepID=UPI0009E03211